VQKVPRRISEKSRYPPNTGVNPIYSFSCTKKKTSDESEVIVGREN
jgi:hypothetical protein